MNKFRSTVIAIAVTAASLALPPANATEITIACSQSGSFIVNDVTNTVKADSGISCAGTAIIPDGVLTIGLRAFRDAPVKSVKLPQGLTTIGQQAFQRSGLLTINIPNSVTYIGLIALSMPSLFNSVEFEPGGSSGLTLDGTSLQYFKGACVVLPSRLTTMSYSTFDANTGLQNIYFSGDAPTVSQDFNFTGATVHHKTTATGFTNPWKGLTTQASTFTTPAFTLSNTHETTTTSTAITGYSVNQTGGSVGCYSIFPAPAAGLAFNSTTGVLSGTPTSTGAPTTYTITGANGAGSTSATFTLSVPPAPAFTLSQSAETITAGTAIGGYSINSTGGGISSYSIAPAARNGLSFNTLTGRLTGTPTISDTGTVYTITGTNVTGSASATYRVKVDSAPAAPPAPPVIPDPQQVSKVGSITPSFGNTGNATPVVISGTFVETIKNISINGTSLPAGSWVQTSNSISLTLPAQQAGTYSIQMYNGSAPVLTALTFTYKSALSLNWTEQKSAADNAWTSVAYGNGRFVAVASSGSGNRVMTSTDGKNWVTASGVAEIAWSSVTYGNGVFVAVSSARSGNKIMSSSDGINWIGRPIDKDYSWTEVKFANGIFVAAGQFRGNHGAMHSFDGATWKESIFNYGGYRAPLGQSVTSLGYGNGYFLITSTLGIKSALGVTQETFYSQDGINWGWNFVKASTPSPVSYQVSGCGKFFVWRATTAFISENPKSWSDSRRANDLTKSTLDALHVAGVFIGVGKGVVTSSSNGEVWIKESAPNGNNWTSVAYGNGLLVAVSNDGSGNRVMTAPYKPVLGTTTPSETVELGSAVKGYQLSTEGCTNSGFAISPVISDPGLTFDSKTGLITGTPTIATTGTTYTISSLDSEGFFPSATYSLVVKGSGSSSTSSSSSSGSSGATSNTGGTPALPGTSGSGNNSGQSTGETSTVKVDPSTVLTPPVDSATAGSTSGGTKPDSSTTKPTTNESEEGPLESPISLNIYFALSSYKIDAASLLKLQNLAKTIAGLGTKITVSITGYAQPTPGSEATDGALSENRALAVAKLLRQYGVTTKIIYKGAGRAVKNVPNSRYVEIVAANR